MEVCFSQSWLEQAAATDIHYCRWTYWINLIFCVVSIVLFSLCYHPPNFENIHGNKSKLRQLMEIDWIGLFLYIGGLIPLLLAFGNVFRNELYRESH